MADFFSRLAERTLDVAPVARPTVGSLFSSENLLPAGIDDMIPAADDGFGDDMESTRGAEMDDRISTPPADRPARTQPAPQPQATSQPATSQPATSQPATSPAPQESRLVEIRHSDRHVPYVDELHEHAPMAGNEEPRRSAIDSLPPKNAPAPAASDADPGPESEAPSPAPTSRADDVTTSSSRHSLLPVQPLDPGTISSFQQSRADAGSDDLDDEMESEPGETRGQEARPDARDSRRGGQNGPSGTTETERGRPTAETVVGSAHAGVAERPERTLVPVKPTTARAPWWSSLMKRPGPAPLDPPPGTEDSVPGESGGIASRRTSADESPVQERKERRAEAASTSTSTSAGRRQVPSESVRRPKAESAPRPGSERRSDAEPSSDDDSRQNPAERRDLVSGRQRQTRSEARRTGSNDPASKPGARDQERDGPSEERRLVPVARQPVPNVAAMMAGEQRGFRREAQQKPEAPPPIRVTIGRIEIKAQTQTPTAPPARQAAPERTGPTITLDNYLKQRNRRSR